MNAEMQSIKDNQVWNLVDLPPNFKTVGSKWLFKKKTDMDGNIHTYKARLVPKGFTQTYRADYEETFSPIADIKAIRILIAIAAYYDYEIWQMDVKIAFLNGRLKRRLYGNNIPMLQDVKSWLGKCFAMKDLDGYFQTWNYFNATQCRLEKSQGPSTPTEVKRMKGIPYASVVGSIMYDVRCTRPDAAFSQNLTSRYQQNSCENYWTAVKNILKYLKNTKDMFLVYGGDSTTELGVTCYTDASWETDRDDLRSQTGFVFVMNEGAVDWKFLQAKHYINVFY
ncbi:putative retrotransposon protein [Tanacetum coccineum]